MVRSDEWRAAFAAIAAPCGFIFPSGRAMALFFTQMGWASWIGVMAAAALFGVLCGWMCRTGKSTGATNLSCVYSRVFSQRMMRFISAAHGLLMLFVAGIMLENCCRAAELALPVHNASWMGAVGSMGVALALNMRNLKRIPLFGAMVVLLCGGCCVLLAADPRGITFHREYEVEPRLSGAVTAATLLATLHAGLSVSLSAGVAIRYSHRMENMRAFAWRCGFLMLAVLSAVNAALMRGGEKLLVEAFPVVLLAARWGKAGFWVSAAMLWLGSVSTLAAVLASVFDLWKVKYPKRVENMTKIRVKL